MYTASPDDPSYQLPMRMMNMLTMILIMVVPMKSAKFLVLQAPVTAKMCASICRKSERHEPGQQLTAAGPASRPAKNYFVTTYYLHVPPSGSAPSRQVCGLDLLCKWRITRPLCTQQASSSIRHTIHMLCSSFPTPYCKTAALVCMPLEASARGRQLQEIGWRERTSYRVLRSQQASPWQPTKTSNKLQLPFAERKCG